MVIKLSLKPKKTEIKYIKPATNIIVGPDGRSE